MTHYHTRNPMPAQEQLEGEIDARDQEERIERFLRKNETGPITPEEVWRYVFGESQVPLTSVRRAITNLTSDGVLEKCPDVRRMGSMGKTVCCWKLKPRQDKIQQSLF